MHPLCMANTPNPEFQAYLESISSDDKYTRWRNLYTLTNTVGKQREHFDFELIVQALQSKQSAGMPSQEKVERPVCAGWYP